MSNSQTRSENVTFPLSKKTIDDIKTQINNGYCDSFFYSWFFN